MQSYNDNYDGCANTWQPFRNISVFSRPKNCPSVGDIFLTYHALGERLPRVA